MATKNFLSLENLTQYDGLIKQYIGTEDAKSIKSITVVGNTVNFFKTADASGTASYSVNLPDVSGFMDKIASASGDKVVKSNSDGSVSETDIDIDKVITGYYLQDSSYGDIMVYGGDGEINASTVNLDDLATKTYVGEIDTTEYDSVVDYIDEKATQAYTDAIDYSEIGINEASTPTTGYLKTYVITQHNATIGTIDIPKDLVVTSGEIVVNPQGQPAGTYLKLTIANQTEPVYINVADLCDVYTAAQSAAQVQLAISSTNEISATIVAGSIGTAELTNSAVTTAKIDAGAVTTAKIADDAVTADKVAIAAHTEAQTASTDGLSLSVTTTDGQVTAVSGGIAAETYDNYGAAANALTNAQGYTDSAIADLDASVAQTAGTDGLALSVTEVDGVVTAISGSIASGTYDASGAAATAKSEVIGASGDAASASTIYGAKAYADAATAPIASSDIAALFN